MTGMSARIPRNISNQPLLNAARAVNAKRVPIHPNKNRKNLILIAVSILLGFFKKTSKNELIFYYYIVFGRFC